MSKQTFAEKLAQVAKDMMVTGETLQAAMGVGNLPDDFQLAPTELINLAQVYSHRNGETEPPTVDGWYWVRSHPFPAPFMEGMLLVSGYDDDLIAYAYDFQEEQFTLDELADLKWWGPVTPPWESGNV